MNSDKKPTHRALRFLEWYCPPKLYEGIEGDVLEKYYKEERELGEKIASRRLWWGVMQFFHPGIFLRNSFSVQIISTAMIRNYLVVACRNVLKNKVFSGINILGLGTGLAACFLIIQFVMLELSYDRFHEKLDRIYRVTNDRFQHGKLIQHGTIMYPTIGPAMARDFPEVEEFTRLMPGGDLNVRVDDRYYRGDNCHFADEHFFSVFSFPMLAGKGPGALKERYNIVLTEKTARRYFQIGSGDYSDVIGKVLYWGLDKEPYTVAGVCADIPENSHIHFDALVSYATLISPEHHEADDSWTWSDMRHYLVLKPGTNYKILEDKFEDFSQRHFQGDKVSGSVEKFYLQPLKDAHLYSDYEYDIARTASGKAVWAMLIVAGFILLIAWINYINLTTSRTLERAKEVGLRKVMGAFKGQLVTQFILESVLISLCAFILAGIMILLSQRTFNQIVGSNLSIMKVLSAMDPQSLILLVSVMVAGVLLSGFYPAFVLSSYQPITVLKGTFQRSSSGNILRKGLVVFQFTASAVLITGTLVVSRQLKFMDNADLGINIGNTLVVESPDMTEWDSTFIRRVEGYESELTSIPGVVNATTSNNVPGARLGRVFNVRLSEQPTSSNITMSFMGVDYRFFDTYSVPLLAGRNFVTTDHHADFEKVNSAIVNVNATKLLGLSNPAEAVGRKMTFWGADKTIVGVVSDFHQEALKKPMEAIVFFPSYDNWYRTSVRVGVADIHKTVAQIETVYNKFFPGNSFNYFLLEDRYKNQYRDDARFGKIVNIFAALAIVISCLGLIGLSSYTAVQRTKEIGIRKVLGASLVSIVSLLSYDFIKLVILASVLAIPIAYFSLHSWLLSYAYRISLGWWLFMLPIAVIVFIAAITMSFQIIRSAMANPSDSLKHE